MDWFKVYSEGILRGSLANSDNATQLIWIKLLALANETRSRDGHLWFAPSSPYPREFIAQCCRATLAEFDYAIDIFAHEAYTDGTPRLIIEDDGTLFLKNWEKYQGKSGKAKEALAAPASPFTKAERSALEREALDMATTVRFIDHHPDMRELLKTNDPVSRKQVVDKLIELNKASMLNGGKDDNASQ